MKKVLLLISLTGLTVACSQDPAPAASAKPSAPAASAAPAAPAASAASAALASSASSAEPAAPATPITPATLAEPAIPATPITPATPAEPAIPATPITPAAPATPTTPAAPTTPAPAGDVTKLQLGVIPNVMKYDKAELTCAPGAKVMLLFRNEKCALMHNFLLLKPGTKDAVGALADKMLTDPDGLKKQYTPATDNVIVKGNKLLGIGQSDLIQFTAPTTPGDYPYICTFPGHWRLMNGVLKVK